VKNNVLPFVFLVFVAVGCSTNPLPPIDKPDRLVKDCDALLAGGAMDRDHWPASIRSLNPVSLDRGENYIMITTFAQTGAGARGYIICRRNNLRIDNFKITASHYADIYEFELVP
jgi:hypothetical protein